MTNSTFQASATLTLSGLGLWNIAGNAIISLWILPRAWGREMEWNGLIAVDEDEDEDDDGDDRFLCSGGSDFDAVDDDEDEGDDEGE